MTIRSNLPKAVLLFVVASLAEGCATPVTTRLPTFATGSPNAERKAFERDDPFPSASNGPETYSRPRGFTEQRSEIRSMRENSRFRGFNRDGASPDPGIPSSKLEYPNTVRD